MLLIWCVYLLHCVVISIYKEYRAVITILVPIRIIVSFDHEKVDITMNSSLIRLTVRGRVRLKNSNTHNFDRKKHICV